MIRGIEKKIDADKRGVGGIKSRIRFINNLLSNECMYKQESVSVYLALCKPGTRVLIQMYVKCILR